MAKKKRIPRTLEINPQSFDIRLVGYQMDANEPDLAEVSMKIGDLSGTAALNQAECARIGKWFTAMSEAMPFAVEKIEVSHVDQ